MEIWKNVNSFLAKISSAELTPCLCYGFDQIQQALEKPPPDGGYEGPWAASMLWIASEWIEQCGSLIFTMMDHKKDHALSREVPTDVDSLYKNLPPHSIERWTFWKSQLLRIATDPDTTHKMQAAVGVMSEAEKGAKNGAENDDKENTEVLQG
jgi:hypothetical protein